jgi:hypothetical protein
MDCHNFKTLAQGGSTKEVFLIILDHPILQQLNVKN